MPRRAFPSLPSTPAASGSVADRTPSFLPSAEPESSFAANLRTLRTNWKWAAFSQFFYTFSTLLAMPDVNLAVSLGISGTPVSCSDVQDVFKDIEDDLARGTALYLPRVMHRLLYTLTQDRKIK